MDLYRILRVSLYFLVASGAFAISVAEQNLFYLLLVVGGALVSFKRMDTGRDKPPRFHFIGALALLLLVFNFMPLREGEQWDRQCLSAITHFLCGLEVLLFFVPYHDLILVCSSLFTLTIVVVSGILEPDATIVLRIACFIALMAWTLFIHSLWRARIKFSSSVSSVSGRRLPSAAETADINRTLPERAIWQGVLMTVVLTASCLIMGFFLFFSAPRPERMMAYIERLIERNEESGGTNSATIGRGQAESESGFREQVRLCDLGAIHENRGHALTVIIENFKTDLGDPSGKIFLRGAAYNQYVSGEWIVRPPDHHVIGSDEARAVEIADPSTPEIQPRGPEIHQTIESVNIAAHNYFSIGPVVRIRASKAEVDDEGSIFIAGGKSLGQCEIWCRRPLYDIPDDAIAAHPDAQRYTDVSGMGEDVREEVRAKALKIKGDATTARETIRRIIAWLKNREHCRYTLRLDQLDHRGDPVRDFLLKEDAQQRRGHCGYFASAFVILCRMNRIPARLATGFAGQAPAATEGSARLVFRNSDAHAWGEVYFNDFGWVPFDATPAPDPEEKETELAQTPPSPPPPAALPPAADGPLDDAWRKGVLGFGPQDQQRIYDKINKSIRSSFGEVGAIFSGDGIGGWIGAALAWLGAGLLIIWGTQAFLRNSGRRLARAGGSAARARAAVSFYNDLLQVLSRRGFVRKPGQTPREFAEHVVRYGGESFRSVLKVTEVFESVRYGGADISQEDFNALQTALDTLRELTFAATPQKAEAKS